MRAARALTRAAGPPGAIPLRACTPSLPSRADVNGLQRKIDIFPEVAPLLVKDMHAEHIDFFVAPAPEPSPLVPFARAFVFTLLVVWIIDALGMLPTFLFGAAIIGWLVSALDCRSSSLIAPLTAAIAPLHRCCTRHTSSI